MDLSSDLNIPTDQVNKIALDVIGFLDRTTSVIMNKYDTATDAASSESDEETKNKTKNFENLRDFLSNMDGYLTRFSDMVYNSTDFVRNPSVRDSKGNKFYKFHEST